MTDGISCIGRYYPLFSFYRNEAAQSLMAIHHPKLGIDKLFLKYANVLRRLYNFFLPLEVDNLVVDLRDCFFIIPKKGVFFIFSKIPPPRP